MKQSSLLVCLFLYALISRFWHIGTLPTIASGAVLIGRFGTGFASCLTLVALYSFVRSYNRSTRIALLTAWVFAVGPWAVEQGRIFSPVQIFTAILLFLLWMAQRLHYKILLFFRYLSISMAVGLFYWFLWEFQRDEGVASFSGAIGNIFTLFSPTMLFVSNTTFWWGGVKEFGMIFLSFVPFFFVGLLYLINSRQWLFLSYVVVFGIIFSFAPQFPEGRQFYFALPFLSYITAVGLNRLNFQTHTVSQLLICIFLALWIYEDIQFWHYYVIHYPMQVRGGMEKIVVPF